MPDFFSESSVEDRVIKNVLLCGNVSQNGYEIPAEAFQSEQHVQKLYSDVPVYLNHCERGKELNRDLKDATGIVRNPRFVEGRPYGDIECYENSNGDTLLALAKAKPKRIGLSHIAAYEPGDALKRRKTRKVTKVVHVESVDVVSNPATTQNFHEDTDVDESTINLLKEQLQSEQTAKQEAKDSLKALQAEHKTLQESVTAKDAEIAALKAEKEKIEAKLQEFEDRLALEQRKEATLAAIKEAGLDLNDTLICSERFIKKCVALTDPEELKAEIEDRKALYAESVKPSGKPLASERRAPGNKNEKTVSDYVNNPAFFS